MIFLTLLGGTALASPLRAQEAAVQQDGGQSASVGLTDIIVTARRRSERLQNVPVAVTAVTGAELERRTVSGISEIAAATPNLRFSEGARGPTVSFVTIRGQTNINQTIAGDPAVGIYFDEVYIARSPGALFGSVYDMGSVEVLRGNQGTLFGRNSTGGAILLTPNRPNLEEVEGHVEAGFGSYGRADFSGVLSVPIVQGSLAARASIQRAYADPFTTSIVNGNEIGFGDRNRLSGRASLRWTPMDTLTFDLTYDYSRVNENGGVSRSVTRTPANTPFYQSFSAIPNPTAYARTEGWLFKANYAASPAFNAKAIFGYRKLNYYNTRDVDATVSTAIDAELLGKQQQFSSELQISGDVPLDTFIAKLSYTGGVYYFTESGSDDSATPLETPTTARRQFRHGRNTSFAGYTQLEGYFTDTLSVFGGLRVTNDQRSLDIGNATAGVCTLVGNPPGCRFSGSTSTTFLSWSAGVRYKLTPTINTYFRAGRGQRSGGLDSSPTRLVSFAPEVLTDYEVGLKGSFLDNHVRANVALFTGNYDNIQRSIVQLDGGGIPYSAILNAAKGRVRGLEAELNVTPVKGLTFSGTLGHTDAKYLSFTDPLTGVDRSGNKFNQVPAWTYSLSADASVSTSAGTFNGRVDYSWQSRVAFEVYNLPATMEPSFGLLNARLGFKPELSLGGIQPEIAVFGKNLTNERYNVDGLTLSPALGATLFRNSNPRVYGVDVRFNF
ncbi:TonB-dependent receptor [Sphingobium sp. Sx8-8]|uniref:TonB-dependent receptor n=1 Tax=Sphingobium sp. Sx8-8 TaxID=2933617 RepID=UPI001F56E665|nr:TonB-dependent receptor [Sphingobium sp. Sx8-8]